MDLRRHRATRSGERRWERHRQVEAIQTGKKKNIIESHAFQNLSSLSFLCENGRGCALLLSLGIFIANIFLRSSVGVAAKQFSSPFPSRLFPSQFVFSEERESVRRFRLCCAHPLHQAGEGEGGEGVAAAAAPTSFFPTKKVSGESEIEWKISFFPRREDFFLYFPPCSYLRFHAAQHCKVHFYCTSLRETCSI